MAVRKDLKWTDFTFPKSFPETQRPCLKDALKLVDIHGIHHPSRDKHNRPRNHEEKTIRRFKYIPEGENVTQFNHLLPPELRLSPKYKRGSTFRLDRNKPVPTLVPGTTNFFIHPTEHLQISEREAAIITGFPKQWTFHGNC